MDDATRQTLLEINRRFYERFADAFSSSRESAWAGWERLLPRLDGEGPLRVLDVGCGNARLASFLSQSSPTQSSPTQWLPRVLCYQGVDSSPSLLAHARERLARPETAARVAEATLVEADVVDGSFAPSGAWDLVAVFGVLHHVPGEGARQRLVARLASAVAPGGLLVLSAWRFDQLPGFASKVVGWEEHNRASSLGVDVRQLEPGDHLLTWAGERHTPRYCHLVDDAEADRLVEASGLRLVDRYRADGARVPLNEYLVLTPGRGPC